MIWCISARAGAACGLALAAVLGAPPGIARAADVGESFLRGAFAPPTETTEFKPYNNWDGPYIGVTIGQSFMQSDMSDNVSGMVRHLLRTTAIENEGGVSSWPSLNGSDSGHVVGGFVGYNWQQPSGLVLGIEGAYQMAVDDLEAFAKDSIARSFSTNSGATSNDVSMVSRGRFAIKDYATVRGRVGYAFEQFLPYASLGVSVARVSYRTSVRIDARQNSGPIFTFTDTSQNDNAVAYGANLARGVDVTLLPNLFLRGEWEYIAFAKLNGIRADMNTFRFCLGLKF
jgi:opacity protein-like surface antigen